MAFAYERPAISAASGRALPRPGSIGALHFGLSGRMVMWASLIGADLIALQLALLLGTELYWALSPTSMAGMGIDPRIQFGALALPIGYLLLDVYRIPGRAPIERFPLRIKATCLLFALLVGWSYSIDGAHWPLPAAGLALVLALALQFVGEGVTRRILIRSDLWGLPAVVIGAGPTGQQVIRILKSMPELGLRPVALFDDLQSASRSTALEDVPVLGSIAESAAYSRRIETAIVTTPVGARGSVDAVVRQLGYRDIIVVPDLHDLPSLWVKARDFNGLIGLQMRRNLLLRRNRLIKQSIDYLVALPLCLVSLPIIAALAVWIMLESDGSPFYVQLRKGKDGRAIKVWKLRTMYSDADQRLAQHLGENPAARTEWDRYCKLTNDPRILPRVGKVLRRTSLDELPQIFNVALGEMSLVGPRPFPDYHLERFDHSFQALRSSVFPGITGLWQVSARSDGDLEIQQALDTYYIRNWSIWIDFYILARTFGAVVAGRGAR